MPDTATTGNTGNTGNKGIKGNKGRKGSKGSKGNTGNAPNAENTASAASSAAGTKGTADCTQISVILDRTGSMSSIRADTIGGFNSFLAEHKRLPTQVTLTLVQFDSLDPYEVVHAYAPIVAVPELTEETFVPRANTPLFDAIGRGIVDLDTRLRSMPVAQRPARIIFVIVTDGQENSSHEFTGAQVRSMVTERRAAGWQIVFLSADEGAIASGESVGVRAQQSMGVMKSSRGSSRLWSTVARESARYSECAAPEMNFDRAKADYAREDAESGNNPQ